MRAPRSPLVGSSVPRLEDRRFILGAGRYTDDVRVSGALHAAFVRSPYAHARVASIDAEAARRAPGVVAVLTGAEYRADGGGAIPVSPVPADNDEPSRPGFDPERGHRVVEIPEPVLADERVRHVGEPVAVVVAATSAQARDAAELVRVAYEELPAVVGVDAALAPDAALVAPQAPQNVCVDARFGDAEGVERAFASAALVVERTFRNPRLSSAHLEPRGVVASYDPATQRYTLVTGGQGVLRQRGPLAAALGVDPASVEIVCPDVGGGFGTRSPIFPEAIAAAWLARRLARPVRWTSDRSESLLTDFAGRDMRVDAGLALDAAGRIVAVRATAYGNIGAYTLSFSSLKNFVRLLTSVYRVPEATVRAVGVLTHTVPTTTYRGAGRPEATYAIERLLDLAAARLGLDAIEIRRRNLIRRDELPYGSPTGSTYDCGDFAGNMERALELADRAGFAARRAASAARGRLRGFGIANYVEAPSGSPVEKVVVRVDPERRVEIVAGTQSSGQGHETTYAQVVADALGVGLDTVAVIEGDTKVVHVGGGTQSDRSMRLAGTLLVRACAELVERGRAIVAAQLESRPEDIRFEDGAFRYAPTGDALDVFAVAALAPLDAGAELNGRIPAFPTGCAICELEVDPLTGTVALARYTQIDDVGQPINPLIVHGQVHGGIAQGVGQGLCEELLIDPETGALLAGSFMDYALPRAADLPPLAIELVEDPTPGNPLRVKGAGETGTTPAPAATMNALADALRAHGIEDLEMPATAPRIWAALRAARRPSA